VYVANAGANSTSIINGTSLVTTIRVGLYPCEVVWDGFNGYAYVVDAGDWNVTVIRDTTVVATLRGGDAPTCTGAFDGVTVDPLTGWVYVPNRYSNNVTAINGSAIVGSISVGVEPTYSVFNPADGLVYVANVVSKSVSLIRGTSVVGTVAVNGTPVSCRYDPFLGTVLVGVSTPLGGRFVILNGTSVMGNLTLSNIPYAFAIDPSNGWIYVGDSFATGASVEILHGGSVTALSTGLRPLFAVYDPISGYVFVSNYGSANVTVINRTSILGTVPVGYLPAALTFDPANNFVYAPNFGSDNVSILDGGSAYPNVASLAAVPANITLGSATVLTSTTSGPAGSWSFVYSGLPPGCSTSNTSTLICVPSRPGSFRVDVTGWSSWGINSSAQVELTVVPVGDTSFVLTPPLVEVESRTTATTQMLTTFGGGIAPFTYYYSGLPGGCTSSDRNPLSCTPTVAGTFDIQVVVTDSGGNVLEANASLQVLPPLTVSINASPNPVEVNHTVSFAPVTAGGLAPYTFQWQVSDGTRSTSPTLNHSFSAPGYYDAWMRVNDSLGGSYSSAVSVTVVPVLFAQLTLRNESVTLGETTVLSLQAMGGASPYRYAYLGLPPGCSPGNSSTLRCTATVAGSYSLAGTVTDSAGDNVTSSATLVVVFRIVATAPASVRSGETFTLDVTPKSEGGPITFRYTGLPGGCYSNNTPLLNCTPIQAGTFTVRVTAEDLWGRQANTSVTVEVVPPPGITPSEEAAALGLIALAAIVIGVVLLARRRPHQPSPESPAKAALPV
jgi:YVTN family beta-propeller protein